MDTQQHLALARAWAQLLDTQFRVGRFAFGLDPIINLVPGLGSALGLVLALYLLWIARDMGAPWWVLGRMLGTIALDFLVGLIPFIGQVADFFYHSNSRNLVLLEGWMGKVARR